jgi:PAS domain S-box-containing protein
MSPLNWFADRKIRYKLLIAYSAIFVLSITVCSSIIYSFVRKTIETSIESELEATTATISNMVRTAADVSIRNYLRSVAEKNREVAGYYHRLAQTGVLSISEAKDGARQIMLNQTIGKTGYLYCIDRSGIMRVHPQPALIGADLSRHAFIQQQKQRKTGYLEYDWQNPGDPAPRPKALYMTYFAPWDWIISASSYRSEFSELVNPDDFRKGVLSLRFGETGYAYLMDSRGNIVLHPFLSGNHYDAEDLAGRRFIREICNRKNGKITYTWALPGSSRPGKKLVIFNHLPELDWIVASSSYLEEIYAPLKTVRRVFIATVLVSLALVLPLTLKISASITTPLQRLMERLSKGEVGIVTPSEDHRPRDEVDELSRYFDAFMVQLSGYSRSLNAEIAVRKEAEDAIRESEARYRQLVDAMPSVLVGVDLFGRVNQWNREAARTTGRSPEAAMGQEVFTLLPPLAFCREDLQHAIENRIPFRKEKVPYTEDGENRFADLMAYPLNVGGLDGAVIRIDDVTERVRIENVMVQTEKMMSVGGLAAGMAHEINNPLGGILQSLQNIFRRLSEALSVNQEAARRAGTDLAAVRAYLEQRKILKFLEDIGASGRRASRIVENMLEFSRSGRSRKAPVRLAGLLDRAVELAAHDYDLKKRYDFRDIQIRRQFDPEVGPVFCVASEIEQVVLNLLRNAAQALAEDISGKEPTITLRLGRENGHAIIEVEDNGPGMEEAVAHRVFEPFFTTKEIGVGTGLGLSVSYFIITHHHGGTMTVDSGPSKGARFTIRLPVEEPAER